jgi:hypothetical protein
MKPFPEKNEFEISEREIRIQERVLWCLLILMKFGYPFLFI